MCESIINLNLKMVTYVIIRRPEGYGRQAPRVPPYLLSSRGCCQSGDQGECRTHIASPLDCHVALLLAMTMGIIMQDLLILHPANSSSHKEWIEALSTAMAASLRDSERVGWAVTVRAMSSALPQYSMCTTAAAISSDALWLIT